MKIGIITVSHGRTFRAKFSQDAEEIRSIIGYSFHHNAEVGLYILLDQFGYFYPCSVEKFKED